MDKLAAIGLGILICIALIIVASGYASDRAADRDRAEAVVIHAQAESRLTTATAGAITSAALLPWGVLAVLGVLGLAIVGLAGAIVVRTTRPGRVIETRTVVYLPMPGQTRPQIWAGVQQVAQIEAGQVVVMRELADRVDPAGRRAGL